MTALKLPKIGKWRRFGAFGPAYEVVGEIKDLPDGDKLVLLRVIETGEEVQERLSKVSADPEAA